jgi:glycine cleavage system aminomethyltransferase T
MSITLQKGIGMAYVDVEAIEKNKNLVIQIRNKEVPIQLCTPPFV